MEESRNESSAFWPSFVDLMTALFFIMLLLFVVAYQQYKAQEVKYEKLKEQENEMKVKADAFEKIKLVKDAIRTMMLQRTENGERYFKYDEKYNRYLLTREVRFNVNRWQLDRESRDAALKGNVGKTVAYLESAGEMLKSVIDSLQALKKNDPAYQEISYVLMITGSASDLRKGSLSSQSYINHNYILSYKRAKSIYEFWARNVADFDSHQYHSVLETSIAGAGLGGVGRHQIYERKNQRFIIQIIPKIGKFKELGD